jgi:hypothetical protein
MAVDRETRFHGFASVVRDTFTLIRDVFVGVLIILLLVLPHQLNQWLANRGLVQKSTRATRLREEDQLYE